MQARDRGRDPLKDTSWAQYGEFSCFCGFYPSNFAGINKATHAI